MNERIRELATQAGYKDFDYAIIAHKFADLIIKECAEKIAHNQKFNWLDAAQAAKDLKQHFGVTE